jgi:hypothetical protein
MKKQEPKLGKANTARRNAEAKFINDLLIQRSRSNADGTHLNRKDKRARTRMESLRKAIREQN